MTEPENRRLSVIIPVLNDATGLGRCLASLRANDIPSSSAEVIVLDNGSTDGSGDVAARAGAIVLECPGLRVGELRNRGGAVAHGQILAFIDADHEIVSGWADATCSLLSEEGVGGAGATYTSPAHGTWVQKAYGRLRGVASGRHDVSWLASGNLAVRREVFTRLGGFDTTLEACEDVDICERLRAAGWRLVSDERLGSVHYGDPATLGALFRSELWRGRDNLRVSLRHWSLRGAPSIVAPVVDLAALATIAAGLVSSPWHGMPVLAAGTAVFAGLAAVRALRHRNVPGPSGPMTWLQSWTVALTYDGARALALIFHARHRRATR